MWLVGQKSGNRKPVIHKKSPVRNTQLCKDCSIILLVIYKRDLASSGGRRGGTAG